MEERGGATNKHTLLTHVKIKKERGGAHRIKKKKKEKKAARSGLFARQRAVQAKVSPGLIKSSSLLLQIRDWMLVPHKEKGWRREVAGLLLLEGAGEDVWSRENSLYHSCLCVCGRNMTPEREESSRPACTNTGGCCGIIFCRDNCTFRTGAGRHFLAAPSLLLIGCAAARARIDQAEERRDGTGWGAQIWDDGRARYCAVETSMTRSGAIACAFWMEGAKERAEHTHNLKRQNASKWPKKSQIQQGKGF